MFEENSLFDEMSECGFEYDEDKDIFINANGQIAHILYFKNKPKAYGYIVLNAEYEVLDNIAEDEVQPGKAREANGLICIHDKIYLKKIIEGYQGDYRPNEVVAVKG
jgi:hypothetical protein